MKTSKSKLSNDELFQRMCKELEVLSSNDAFISGLQQRIQKVNKVTTALSNAMEPDPDTMRTPYTV